MVFSGSKVAASSLTRRMPSFGQKSGASSGKVSWHAAGGRLRRFQSALRRWGRIEHAACWAHVRVPAGKRVANRHRRLPLARQLRQGRFQPLSQRINEWLGLRLAHGSRSSGGRPRMGSSTPYSAPLLRSGASAQFTSGARGVAADRRAVWSRRTHSRSTAGRTPSLRQAQAQC